MIELLIIALWVLFFAAAAVVSATRNKRRNHTISSDGHVVPASQDLTCESLYGHDHHSVPGTQRRYVVHEDPEEGYVILNGVKRMLKDCKDL